MNLTFGEWLRDKREAAGITQIALAEHVGMTKLQVSRLETGLQKATADRVRPLIEALPVDALEAASWLERLEAVQTPVPKPTLYPSAPQQAEQSPQAVRRPAPARNPASSEPCLPFCAETYNGVEIRVRLQEQTGAAGTFWSGSYAFFTGRITRRSNERVTGALEQRFATESDAEEACFAAAFEAVDREVRIAEIIAGKAATPHFQKR